MPLPDQVIDGSVIGVLKEHEAGKKVADIARDHGITEAALYTWKKQVRRDGR